MKTKTAKVAASLLILALALCLALPSSLAAGSSGRDRLKPSSSSPTVRREAFEYYGLCIQRHQALVDYLGKSSLTVASSPLGNTVDPTGSKSNCFEVSTPFGDIQVDKTTHEVVEVSAIYYIVSEGSVSNDSSVLACLAIISALEYSAMDEFKEQSRSLYSSGKSSPGVRKIVDLYLYGGLSDKLQSAVLAASSSETLVYSGNYDYYISYFKASDGSEVFFLTARARS